MEQQQQQGQISGAGQPNDQRLPGSHVNFIETLVTFAVSMNVSDIHLKVGNYPIFRINGDLYTQEKFGIISKDGMEKIADSMMDRHQLNVFHENRDVDLAYSLSNVGRFRVNI